MNASLFQARRGVRVPLTLALDAERMPSNGYTER
jgi:hypothetical protein